MATRPGHRAPAPPAAGQPSMVYPVGDVRRRLRVPASMEEGSVNLVLVHGSYAGAWAWDLVRPELERRGHQVTAVRPSWSAIR